MLKALELSQLITRRAKDDYEYVGETPFDLAEFLNKGFEYSEAEAEAIAWAQFIEFRHSLLDKIAEDFDIEPNLLKAMFSDVSNEALLECLNNTLNIMNPDCEICVGNMEMIHDFEELDDEIIFELCLDILDHLSYKGESLERDPETEKILFILNSLDKASFDKVMSLAISEMKKDGIDYTLLRESLSAPAKLILDTVSVKENPAMNLDDISAVTGIKKQEILDSLNESLDKVKKEIDIEAVPGLTIVEDNVSMDNDLRTFWIANLD